MVPRTSHPSACNVYIEHRKSYWLVSVGTVHLGHLHMSTFWLTETRPLVTLFPRTKTLNILLLPFHTQVQVNLTVLFDYIWFRSWFETGLPTIHWRRPGNLWATLVQPKGELVPRVLFSAEGRKK